MDKGKTILKAILIVAAISVFGFLYSLLQTHQRPHNSKHENVDMNEIYFLYSCFILLLIGMPILR